MINRLILVSVLGIFLTACNGSSGDNGDNPFDGGDPTPPTPVQSLTLSILDANCEAISSNSFTTAERICIEASLTEDAAPIANEIVTFSSGIGIFDIDSKLTDANGVAQVFLDADAGVVGAATVNASFGTLQAQESIEFTTSDEQPQGTTSVTLAMLNQSGEPVLRFRADQQVRLIATLIDAANEPIENEIIAFSTTRGILPIPDALTNAQGQAEVQLSAELTDIGAAIASVNILGDDTGLIVDSINFEIQSVDAVEEDVVRIGYFDGDVFNEGVLGVTGFANQDDVLISAGATLGLQVGLADANDQPIIGSTPITFTSSCVVDGRATIDESVATVNGRASSTYEDISCATGSGNDDIITATVLVNNTPLTVTRAIELQPESIGSIEFISASPESIVLQGTGGQGSESVSTVTFQVNGALGNPLAQKQVDFELSTTVGGLTIDPASGLTNSEGQVSTRVTAGNVPTSVRVTATTTGEDNQSIRSQSDILSVNTGLPDQNSFSLAADDLNPEANSINGQEVNITAYLADSFNNPVPDGTAVSFTTEGGQIQPSCTTVNGSCSVLWTSSDPRVDDHRITILATAIGHETLYDSNGNNVYDDADGGALDLGEDSGFDIPTSTQTGFSDIAEAWRDDNENGVFDVSETFLDFDTSGDYSVANSRFDGPQCQATECGGNGLHVRRAMVLIMASSGALMSIFDGATELANNQTGTPADPVLSIPRGSSETLRLVVSDTALQTMPSGTTIEVTSNNGDLAGEILTTVRSNNRSGGATLNFVLTNNLLVDQDPIDATVVATVTSPSGVVSTLTIVISLD